jgi:predicted phosphodiesterase
MKTKPLNAHQQKLLKKIKPLHDSGMTSVQVAAQMGLSPRVVQNYMAMFRARGLMAIRSKLPEGSVKLEALPAKILELCKGRPRTLGELSLLCDRSKASVEEAIKKMYAHGMDISYAQDTKKVEVQLGKDDKRFAPINLDGLKKTRYKFGVVSDTHLGSKCQQLTLLKSAYADFDRENVDFVIHAGDLVDGHKMYKGQEYELFMHSADEQRDYAVEQYPRLKNGKKTYIIAGNHDESFKKSAGYNIVRDICTKRSDLVYEGMIGATFNIGRLRIEAVHPSGGVSYARSYKSQKHAENLMSALIEVVRSKKDLSVLPHIMILGNWHIADILPDYQGMVVVTQPCFQSQTSYLRAKGLTPNIGYTLFEISLDSAGNLQEMWHKYQPLGHLAIKNDF